jgi:hypothetical protein
MYSLGEIQRCNSAHSTPDARPLSKKARAAVRHACERVLETVTHGPVRDNPDRAHDAAFYMVRGAFDTLRDYDPSIAGEFAGALLTDTAIKGVAHIQNTLDRLNRVQ